MLLPFDVGGPALASERASEGVLGDRAGWVGLMMKSSLSVFSLSCLSSFLAFCSCLFFSLAVSLLDSPKGHFVVV